MNTIYTMKRDNQGNLTALILTSDNTGNPLEITSFKIPMDLHQTVKEHYGNDATYVSPRFFQTALEDRRTHSPELLEILKNSGEGDLSRRWVYGSPCRPIGRIWARIPGAAIYLDADREKTGYYSYVVVLAKLDKDIIDKYDFVFISHGKEQ